MLITGISPRGEAMAKHFKAWYRLRLRQFQGTCAQPLQDSSTCDGDFSAMEWWASTKTWFDTMAQGTLIPCQGTYKYLAGVFDFNNTNKFFTTLNMDSKRPESTFYCVRSCSYIVLAQHLHDLQILSTTAIRSWGTVFYQAYETIRSAQSCCSVQDSHVEERVLPYRSIIFGVRTKPRCYSYVKWMRPRFISGFADHCTTAC